MTRVIGLEYVYTQEEAIRSSRAATRVVFPKYRFIPWFGVLLLAMAAYLVAREPVARPVALIPGWLGLFFLSIPLLTRSLVVRSFRRLSSAHATITWQISPDGLVTRGPDGESRLTWSGLIKVVASKHGILLFTSPRVGHWLPRSAFASADDLAQFEAWVDAKRSRFGTGAAAPATTSIVTQEPTAGEAITARYTYTEADALASQRVLVRSAPLFLRYIAFSPLAIVVVVLAFENESMFATFVTVAFMGGAMSWAGWRTRRKQRKAALKAFAQSPNANREIEWTISQQHIAIRSDTSNNAHGWRSVVKVRESDDGFLICPHPQVGSWLPHRAFASPHDTTLLRAWINRHGIDFRRV